MSEKKWYSVYLDNWMINAGIIGFLNIILTDKEKEKIINCQESDELSLRDNRIIISFNKLEFENSVLADNDNFAKRFFEEAFKRYGRYNRFIKSLENIKEEIEKYNKEEDEAERENIKEIISDKWEKKGAYKLLVEKYEEFYKVPVKLDEKIKDDKTIKSLNKIIEKCMKVLRSKKYYQEFFENDVQFYLSNYFANDKSKIKKQSGFLNVSVKGSKEEHFYKNILEPIITNNIKYEKDYYCIISGAQAKKKSSYNSGLVSFLGHPGNENFFWLGTPTKLPLSEIYELLYWSAFAGFVDISKGTSNIRFLFCNQDSSIIDLYRANHSLHTSFKQPADKSISYINFLLNLIIAEKEKSTYKLQNTVLIDIDNTKGFYTKIHSLYISREKANFIAYDNNFKKFNALSKISFTDNGTFKSIGLAALERIIDNSLTYTFLYYLSKVAASDGKEGKFIKSSSLQLVNYLINNYYKTFYFNKERNYMKNEELFAIYEHGKKVAQKIKTRNDENKIKGMVHKFLNYQKSGNANAFMNLFMRIHMAYELMTPDSIIKCMENKVNFNAIGYSFINGLLNTKNKEENKNEGVNKHE